MSGGRYSRRWLRKSNGRGSLSRWQRAGLVARDVVEAFLDSQGGRSEHGVGVLAEKALVEDGPEFDRSACRYTPLPRLSTQ